MTAPDPPPSDSAFGRSAAIVAVGTVASRVTGLLRLLALTYALGIAETRLADTFNIANTLPNILYELVLGGVFSSVFIPLVIDGLRREGGLESVGTLVWTALAVLFTVSVMAALAAPLLVWIFTARGGVGADAQTALATFLFRFFAFQIFFYGAAAIGAGLLNARRRFGVAAFAPAANNMVAVAVFLSFAWFFRANGIDVSLGGRLLLGAGTTIAVAAMAVVHIVPAVRAVGRLPVRFSLKEPLVRRFARLSGWTFVYAATSQVAAAVTFALAYGTQGGASAYITAFTFFHLPYGVLAVSVTTAVVPRLAERAVEGDLPGFRYWLERAMVTTVAVVLPAGIAYMVVAHPAMRALLQRGEVTAASADYVARLVQILTVSLVPFSLWLLLLRGFYALQDARTPARINFLLAGLFIASSFALYPILRVEGLAWVSVIGYTAGTATAGRVISRRLGGIEWRPLALKVTKIAAASAVMALLMLPLVSVLERDFPHLPGQAFTLVVAAGVGAVAYMAAGFLLDVDEIKALARLRANLGLGSLPRPGRRRGDGDVGPAPGGRKPVEAEEVGEKGPLQP